MKLQTLQWNGLDQFGNVYESVDWDHGPQGIFFHKICKLQVASKYKLQQALKRKEKQDSNNAEDTGKTGEV